MVATSPVAPHEQHNSTLAISPLVTNRTIPSSVIHHNIAHHVHRQEPFNSPLLTKTTPFAGLQSSLRKVSDSAPFNVSVNNSLTPAEKLRLWRHDALMQHHYATAAYIGDKVLSLTNDPNDAFWLAQAYYSSGSYARARDLMAQNELDSTSVSCRYLTALCLIKMEKYDEALDIVGETNPFHDPQGAKVKNQDGGIKLESSLCLLRGKIYSHTNNFERAKDAYKEAVLVDARNFEAFDELVKNDLMTSEEEWEFIQQIDFDDLDENAELIKSLYTSKLSKYINLDKYYVAESVLEEEYNLKENNDLLLAKSEVLFTQSRFEECIQICEEILKKDEYNFSALPNYVSCLYELEGKNKLFLVSHHLADKFPGHPVTWLAVGVYYLSISKIPEARKYFSKATILDPNFGQAWIGFAHTFAAEGEHEQAISAYSTASRFFPGTHLPNLFMGMQYIQMSNLSLAEEYLTLSYSLCPTDPLVLNEMGVVYYHKNHLSKAESYFQQALNASSALNSESKSWVSIHANLGHVYRKLQMFDKAIDCFNKVLRISNKDANIFSSLGLLYLHVKEYTKAVEVLHNALALKPNDQIALDILNRALASIESTAFNGKDDYLKNASNAVDDAFKTTTKPHWSNPTSAITKARQLIQGAESSDEEGDLMDLTSDME